MNNCVHVFFLCIACKEQTLFLLFNTVLLHFLRFKGRLHQFSTSKCVYRSWGRMLHMWLKKSNIKTFCVSRKKAACNHVKTLWPSCIVGNVVTLLDKSRQQNRRCHSFNSRPPSPFSTHGAYITHNSVYTLSDITGGKLDQIACSFPLKALNFFIFTHAAELSKTSKHTLMWSYPLMLASDPMRLSVGHLWGQLSQYSWTLVTPAGDELIAFSLLPTA